MSDRVICLACGARFKDMENYCYCPECSSLRIITYERWLQEQFDNLSSFILAEFNLYSSRTDVVETAIKVMKRLKPKKYCIECGSLGESVHPYGDLCCPNCKKLL